MKSKRLLWLAVVAALLWAGAGAPRIGLGAGGNRTRRRAAFRTRRARSSSRRTSRCGRCRPTRRAITSSFSRFTPTGTRFCYKYQWNGETQTVAPTIRVRRGERFAVRIVNDIPGPSPGGARSSAAIPACMPMGMPAANDGALRRLSEPHDRRPFHARSAGRHESSPARLRGTRDQENVFLSTLSTPVHACEYRITIPATQPPGTYIYHPHAHGASDDAGRLRSRRRLDRRTRPAAASALGRARDGATLPHAACAR